MGLCLPGQAPCQRITKRVCWLPSSTVQDPDAPTCGVAKVRAAMNHVEVD